MNITLFPLHTILFPGGPLPLRIFEPRYLHLVKDCLKNDKLFGVCLIKEGKEAGEAAIPHEIGTLAKIVDWNQLPDRLLGITAVGHERFSVGQWNIDTHELIIAEVTTIPEPPSLPIEEKFNPLVELLQKALPHAEDLYKNIESNWQDSSWVAFRIAELLPPDNDFKLDLLKAENAEQRINMVYDHLKNQMRNSTLT